MARWVEFIGGVLAALVGVMVAAVILALGGASWAVGPGRTGWDWGRNRGLPALSSSGRVLVGLALALVASASGHDGPGRIQCWDFPTAWYFSRSGCRCRRVLAFSDR